MAGKARFSHRAEWAVLRAVTGLADRMGDRSAERLGERLGRAVWSLGMRRDVTLDNLRHAFPDREEDWIRDVAKRSYAHLGREMVVTLRFQNATPAEIVARTRITGLEIIREAIDAGTGVVLVTGHLGNWELSAASLAARGIPVDVVMQRQSNPLADEAINANRRRLGLNPIDRREAPRKGLRTLRNGGLLGFVADQDARSGGVFVPFFGRPASTHRGPALLALRTGAPLIAGTCIRTQGGTYDAVATPILASRDGDPDEAVERMTAAYTAVFEAAIRQAPEQYLWQHRRWKSSPSTASAPTAEEEAG